MLFPYRARAKIRVDALVRNFHAVRAVAEGAALCCVIKADAYGHGAVALARLYQSLGADRLAVATAEEALTLRRAAVRLPLLVLGPVPPEAATELAAQGVAVCLHSAEQAAGLSDALRGARRRLGVHIKVDTGMHRLGFSPSAEGAAEMAAAIESGDFLLEGCFTHLHSADREADCAQQMALYHKALGEMEAVGLVPRWRHAAASAAALLRPEARLDMVRVGLALYGIPPREAAAWEERLRPALTLTARVVAVRQVAKGDTVGYGGAYRAPRDGRIATVALGYADGLRRDAAAHGLCLGIGGGRAPLLGRVSMDMCAADVTDLPVAVGDEAIVYGEGAQGVAAAAEACGTIAYELLTAIGPRVAREY